MTHKRFSRRPASWRGLAAPRRRTRKIPASRSASRSAFWPVTDATSSPSSPRRRSPPSAPGRSNSLRIPPARTEKASFPSPESRSASPVVYDTHRLFVFLRDAAASGSWAGSSGRRAVERAGHPVVRIGVGSPQLLAQEFFRFEIATAVAGAVLDINPFDQPDVEASKIATRQMTEAFEKTGSLPSEPPVFEAHGIALYTDNPQCSSSPPEWARMPRLKVGSGPTSPASMTAITSHCLPISTATTRGYRCCSACARPYAIASGLRLALQFGPRFLHSTGQAYKGGPNSGVFLQITAEPAPDLDYSGAQGELRRDRGRTGAGGLPCAGRARPAPVTRAHRG